MTATNRTRIALVRETTAGTTPTTPRTRTKRITAEALSFAPEFLESDEIRADRMMGDPILIMQGSGGTISDELSYPDDESPDSELYRSAFYSAWANTPMRFNDGVADSIITALTAATGVITMLTGAAFVLGHLVRLTGFGVLANNNVFKITTGSATVPAVGAGQLTDEAVPPAAARVKVVGFQGASGDITALTDGLGSTALNFTTLGLVVGQWINIGGAAVGERFATAALNNFARIIAITATKLTLDNLPTGWTTDAGTGKTLKVWFGDTIRNGTTKTSVTIEKGFMAQAVPTYIANRGMVVGQVSHSITNRQKVTRQWTFAGMGGGQGVVSLDDTPDAQTLGQIMAAHANVGRLAENGAKLTAPNWARSLEFTIDNNLRTVEDVQETAPQAINEGEFKVTGRVESYFGDNSLLAKFYAGTPTSLSSRIQKNGQALVFQFPRVIYRGGGNPAAAGKNQDVMLALEWQASVDALTGVLALLDRLEYFESS